MKTGVPEELVRRLETAAARLEGQIGLWKLDMMVDFDLDDEIGTLEVLQDAAAEIERLTATVAALRPFVPFGAVGEEIG